MTSTQDDSKPKSRTALLVGLLAVGVLLGVAWKLGWLGPLGDAFGSLQGKLKDLLSWIRDQGAAGPVIFIAVYVVATVLFLPGSVLTLGAGLVFGVVLGSVYVSIASVAGATCAFLIGRYAARGWVAQKIDSFPRFRAVDEAVANEGWKIVALTRLSPAFPFVFLNYAYGLTKVSLGAFVLASWIFMIPGTIMYVYFGSLAENLATLNEGAEKSTAQRVLFWVGLAATVGVTLYVTKVAKRALAKRVDDEQETT